MNNLGRYLGVYLSYKISQDYLGNYMKIAYGDVQGPTQVMGYLEVTQKVVNKFYLRDQLEIS